MELGNRNRALLRPGLLNVEQVVLVKRRKKDLCCPMEKLAERRVFSGSPAGGIGLMLFPSPVKGCHGVKGRRLDSNSSSQKKDQVSSSTCLSRENTQSGVADLKLPLHRGAISGYQKEAIIMNQGARSCL